MKKIILSWFLSVMFLAATNAQYGTHRTGYEGDFFSLEGAIEVFKQSHSLRDFERRINTRDTWVNNLDLDYDGRTDYIRVEHRRHGNFHAIILQIPLGRYDVQDVAVIEIEKIGRRRALLQIVGDVDLYGDEVIVEPVLYEGYSYNGDYRSGYGDDYVNVFYWDAVQHILGYNYTVYVSPYRWHYYPTWWSPWRQCLWNDYRPRVVVYHRHYHVVHVHRVVNVHNFYKPHRVYSHNVLDRTNKVRVKHGKAPVHRKPVTSHNGTRNDTHWENSRSNKQPKATTNTTRTNERVKTQERVTKNSPRTPQKADKQSTRTARGNDGVKSSPRVNTSSSRSTTSKATKSTSRSSGKAAPSKKNTRSSASSNKRTSTSSSKATKKSTPQKSSRSSSKASRSISSSRSSASRSSSKSSRSSASSSRSSSSSKASKSTSKPRSSSSSRNKRG